MYNDASRDDKMAKWRRRRGTLAIYRALVFVGGKVAMRRWLGAEGGGCCAINRTALSLFGDLCVDS